MSIKFKYTLSQALQAIRRSPLLIIGLASILAMISVMNIYVYNARNYQIENFESSYFEIGIYNSTEDASHIAFNHDIFGSNFIQIDQQIKSSFSIESSNPLYYLTNDNLQLAINKSGNLDRSDDLALMFSDINFYNSDHFDRYFELYDGRRPQNTSEYIIDIVSAVKLGFHESTEDYLPFAFLDKQNASIIVDTLNINQTNGKIVGIFIPKQTLVKFFDYSPAKLTYSQDYSSVDSFQHATLQEWKNAIIMGLIDFDFNYNNPVITQLNSSYNNLPINSTQSWVCVSAMGYHYDRSTININSISREEKVFHDKWFQLYNLFEHDTKIFTTSMYELFYDSLENARNLYVYQIMNIPLLICAVLIGQILVKASFSSRLISYNHALIKGYPRKMINNQLIWEIICMGTIVGILSVVFSWIIYRPVQNTLNPLIGSSTFTSFGNDTGYYENVRLFAPEAYLKFSLTVGLVLGIIAIGILLCAVIYAKLIYHFNQMKRYEIADSLEQFELNSLLSENLLISQNKKKKKKQNKAEKKLQEKSNDSPKIEENKYKSVDYEYSKGIKKFGLVVFLIGWVPILLILFIQLGYYSEIDRIAYAAQKMNEYNKYFVFPAFFSPFVIIYGIVRWLLFEKPLFYANICEKFTGLFLGEKGVLNALETLRFKNLKKISLILAVISGSFIFCNLALNSSMISKPTLQNVIIGGDFNIQATNTRNYMEEGNQTILFDDLITIEKIISNQSYYSDDYMDVATNSLISLSDISSANYGFDTIVLTNFSKYCHVAQSRQVQSIIPNLYSKLQKTLLYNDQNSEYIGVLVTDRFLNYYQYEVGAIFTINPELFPFSENFASQELISLKIIDSIETIPGLLRGYSYDYQILADFSNFVSIGEELTYDSLNFIGTLNSTNTDSYREIIFQDVCPMEEVAFRYSDPLYLNVATEVDDGTTRIFSPKGDTKEIYLLYIESAILLIFLVISIVILILQYRKENRGYHGLLLVQGFGKKNLSMLVIAQLIFVIFSTLFIGLLVGFSAGGMWTVSYLRLESFNGVSNLNLPIVFNLKEFLFVIGVLLSGTFLFMGVLLFTDRKKEYAQYLSHEE
ncbi:hypothetical protein NEF87_004694 [Candidatus Lokiarchaeum ossiferum]|uniref:ABC3 transporter permease C-terminal domain-containing protein n=1 Tax=Candidatus Lokiarchaeum ossiferum TaxID=2951803 RepID=A0ABY6I0R5_9ARCH|nr:hypothetical protein NEF87_004694 [Candidatus Lokiarchaeum sp. B-35]